ncbi:MAG: GNAT family N-acetyltransferase, partial [Proteobacteria bacterium]|nr:GNAT family N-acetyltransferase [Pseudomonadota bacterium]
MRVPVTVETERLVLRPPRADDAPAVLARYAADPEVTRWLAWPRHRTLADTRAFLEFAQAEWARWPAGPLLIECRASGALLGSTGLAFEAADRATTGYVLARDAWGRGLASEALSAVVALAARLGVARLAAHCHVEHLASSRVLERAGFVLEGVERAAEVFPNLGRPGPQDVRRYACTPASARPGPGARSAAHVALLRRWLAFADAGFAGDFGEFFTPGYAGHLSGRIHMDLAELVRLEHGFAAAFAPVVRSVEELWGTGDRVVLR